MPNDRSAIWTVFSDPTSPLVMISREILRVSDGVEKKKIKFTCHEYQKGSKKESSCGGRKVATAVNQVRESREQYLLRGVFNSSLGIHAGIGEKPEMSH